MEEVHENFETVSPGDAGPMITAAQGQVGAVTPLAEVAAPNAECPMCGDGGVGVPPTYIYAMGTVAWRYPRLSVEKEFAQAIGRAGTAGLTDGEALHKALTQRENRYLARKLCWVMSIEGLETYILQPRDPADVELLIETVRARPSPTDRDLVIGLRGPIAPPELCNGLMVPVVFFDQLYSFDRQTLIGSIPRPKTVKEEKFAACAEQVFDHIIQMADNAGATDEHRALNYLAVRYPAIYETAVEAFERNCTLAGLEVRPSRLSGVRKIVDVIFTYANRTTDVVEKYFVRADVTEEFPFLVTKLMQFFDR